jgi:hypothetical protein
MAVPRAVALGGRNGGQPVTVWVPKTYANRRYS